MNVWLLAALWVGLALIATLLAIWLKVSTALSEIVVGTVAQLIIGVMLGLGGLGASTPWITFLAGTGAIVLTFLAGAELDPAVFRVKWREAVVVGLAGFFAPFLGVTAIARWVLGWPSGPSWLAGVALSTTSVAVVYAVMLELGFNVTEYGKAILAACFVNDLGTVLALGLLFSPFTVRSLVFVVVSTLAFAVLPSLTPRFFRRYGGRVSELETKFILFALFGLGGLALWADSEPVLPAYVIGMVLAGTVGKDHQLIRRLRTLTFGLLTPFYFIRAGSFVSVPALVAAPLVLTVLFFAKMVAKLVGVFPAVNAFRYSRQETSYYTLMMSTGLTFGTISALFGLSHGIITGAQYSHLVAAVIGSAVIPTLIANAFFMPRHLVPRPSIEPSAVVTVSEAPTERLAVESDVASVETTRRKETSTSWSASC
jgi:Kef-type K+ transport system membrane component KefB